MEKSFLCREHGKYHFCLCVMDTCMDKILPEPLGSRKGLNNHSVNVLQHINILAQSSVVSQDHVHEGVLAPAENTKYLMEHLYSETKPNGHLPTIVYYDSLASCSLLDDGDKPDVGNLVDLQEKKRTEKNMFFRIFTPRHCETNL